MNEVISLKGVSFDRKYFHSTTLLRPGKEAGGEYAGNLVLTINFIIPDISGNKGVLKTMFLKGLTPIETIDLYLSLLRKLRELIRDNNSGGLPDRDELIKEHLTADEKALIEQTALNDAMQKSSTPPSSIKQAPKLPPAAMNAPTGSANPQPESEV